MAGHCDKCPASLGEEMAKEAMSKVIPVRLSPDQHQRIERAAQTMGVGVSTYLRHAAITKSKREEIKK